MLHELYRNAQLAPQHVSVYFAHAVCVMLSCRHSAVRLEPTTSEENILLWCPGFKGVKALPAGTSIAAHPLHSRRPTVGLVGQGSQGHHVDLQQQLAARCFGSAAYG